MQHRLHCSDRQQKNVLYSVVNSNAMSVETDGYLMPVWMMVMIVVDVVIVLLLALWGTLAIRSVKRSEKAAGAKEEE